MGGSNINVGEHVVIRFFLFEISSLSFLSVF